MNKFIIEVYEAIRLENQAVSAVAHPSLMTGGGHKSLKSNGTLQMNLVLKIRST